MAHWLLLSFLTTAKPWKWLAVSLSLNLAYRTKMGWTWTKSKLIFHVLTPCEIYIYQSSGFFNCARWSNYVIFVMPEVSRQRNYGPKVGNRRPEGTCDPIVTTLSREDVRSGLRLYRTYRFEKASDNQISDWKVCDLSTSTDDFKHLMILKGLPCQFFDGISWFGRISSRETRPWMVFDYPTSCQCN